MPMKIEDRDMGAKRIQSEMRKVHGSFVTIGVHSGAGNYPGGQSVALVAAFNEFGTQSIPSRPFMRSAIDTNKSKINQRALLEFRSITDGSASVRHALDRLGFTVQEMIKARIQRSSSWAIENAPSTARQKRKGGAIRGPTPLINSGLMLRSITFKTTVRGF